MHRLFISFIIVYKIDLTRFLTKYFFNVFYTWRNEIRSENKPLGTSEKGPEESIVEHNMLAYILRGHRRYTRIFVLAKGE